ncbi:unnamed protein product, partial [Dibothriocephalus latus]
MASSEVSTSTEKPLLKACPHNGSQKRTQPSSSPECSPELLSSLASRRCEAPAPVRMKLGNEDEFYADTAYSNDSEQLFGGSQEQLEDGFCVADAAEGSVLTAETLHANINGFPVKKREASKRPLSPGENVTAAAVEVYMNGDGPNGTSEPPALPVSNGQQMETTNESASTTQEEPAQTNLRELLEYGRALRVLAQDLRAGGLISFSQLSLMEWVFWLNHLTPCDCFLPVCDSKRCEKATDDLRDIFVVRNPPLKFAHLGKSGFPLLETGISILEQTVMGAKPAAKCLNKLIDARPTIQPSFSSSETLTPLQPASSSAPTALRTTATQQYLHPIRHSHRRSHHHSTGTSTTLVITSTSTAGSQSTGAGGGS